MRKRGARGSIVVAVLRYRAKWLGLAGALILTTGAGAQKIEYHVEKAEDSLFGHTLQATAGGKTYTLIDEPETCLEVVD